jgi:hypothetical protein
VATILLKEDATIQNGSHFSSKDIPFPVTSPEAIFNMCFDATARDDVGLTLLMAAAPYGNQRLLTVLLALPDIKINAQDYSGRTALMCDVVKLLMQQK